MVETCSVEDVILISLPSIFTDNEEQVFNNKPNQNRVLTNLLSFT